MGGEEWKGPAGGEIVLLFKLVIDIIHTYIHTYIHTAVSGQGGLETVERPALMLQWPTSVQVVDTGTHWVESFQESLRE